MPKSFRATHPMPWVMLLFMLWSCAGQTEQDVARDISRTELKSLMENRPDLLLLDVRTDMEWKSGHIDGAAFLDFLEGDFSAMAHALPKNQPIALYCAAGGRSEDAMNNMAKAGFKELYNLKGGFFGWEDAGEAVSFDAPAPWPKAD